MNRKPTATATIRLYREAYELGFSHIEKPALRVYCFAHPEYCALYWPDTNRIEIWLGSHETLDDVYDTIVHELCHAEQEAKQQPLLHGPRFSRRIRNQKRTIAKRRERKDD
jgi:hypothetical protein